MPKHDRDMGILLEEWGIGETKIVGGVALRRQTEDRWVGPDGVARNPRTGVVLLHGPLDPERQPPPAPHPADIHAQIPPYIPPEDAPWYEDVRDWFLRRGLGQEQARIQQWQQQRLIEELMAAPVEEDMATPAAVGPGERGEVPPVTPDDPDRDIWDIRQQVNFREQFPEMNTQITDRAQRYFDADPTLTASQAIELAQKDFPAAEKLTPFQEEQIKRWDEEQRLAKELTPFQAAQVERWERGFGFEQEQARMAQEAQLRQFWAGEATGTRAEAERWYERALGVREAALGREERQRALLAQLRGPSDWIAKWQAQGMGGAPPPPDWLQFLDADLPEAQRMHAEAEPLRQWHARKRAAEAQYQQALEQAKFHYTAALQEFAGAQVGHAEAMAGHEEVLAAWEQERAQRRAEGEITPMPGETFEQWAEHARAAGAPERFTTPEVFQDAYQGARGAGIGPPTAPGVPVAPVLQLPGRPQFGPRPQVPDWTREIAMAWPGMQTWHQQLDPGSRAGWEGLMEHKGHYLPIVEELLGRLWRGAAPQRIQPRIPAARQFG